jgi:hypothetical protein
LLEPLEVPGQMTQNPSSFRDRLTGQDETGPTARDGIRRIKEAASNGAHRVIGGVHGSLAFRRFLALCGLGAALAAAGGVSGCGSSSSSSTPSVTITIPTTALTIEQGQSVNLAATSSVSGGVSWAVTGDSCANAACGTFPAATETTSSAIYVAPASVSAATTVLITATSVSNSSAVAFLNITFTPPIVVTPSPNVSAVAAGGGTRNFTASVLYDENNAGVTWSVSGTGCAGQGLAGTGCGLLSNQTSTSVTYTSPNNQPSPNTITITATSIADSSRAGTASINIGTSLPLAVTITNKVAFAVAGGAAVNLNATVQNEPPPGSGVSWKLTAGGLACQPICGTLTNATATSVTYNPPPTVPGIPSNSPTITATSNMDGTTSDSDTFSILAMPQSACVGTPTGTESQLNGTYALLLQGFQGSPGTVVAMAASFTADGAGNVTGGELDRNSVTGYQHLLIAAGGSSYTVGPDPTGAGNVGCLNLNTSTGSFIALHFALGVVASGKATQGHIIEFDDSTGTGTLASGILRRQDPSAFLLSALSPNYAFGTDGLDATGKPVAIGGSFAVNASGMISSVATDVNDGGTVKAAITGGSGGPISAISGTTGRATTTITTGTNQTYAWAIYVVSASQFFILETDAFSGTATLTSGRALASSSGAFTAASLSGNYVFHYTGTLSCNSVPCAIANLGVLSFDGTSAFSSNLSQYDSYEGFQTVNPSGTYTVGSTGRGVLTASAGGSAGSLPVAYLVSPPVDGISGFLVAQDSSAAFGLAEFQPTQPYTLAGLAGNYFLGTEDPHDPTVTQAAGVVNLTSGGGVLGTESLSAPFGLDSSHAIGGTVAMAAGGTGSIFAANFFAVTNVTGSPGTGRIYFINIGTLPAVITILDHQ